MFKKIALCLFSIVSVSCSPNVFVVDEAGNPIVDAQIRPLTRSFNYPPVATDKKGSAHIHQDLPTIENLLVSKKGYVTPAPVNYNLPKPITVVLKRK